MTHRSLAKLLVAVMLSGALIGDLSAQSANEAEKLFKQARQSEQGGKYPEAEALFKRGLAIAERSMGAESPDVADALINLGEFYYNQHRYRIAEPLFRRALEIREKALGYSHPKVAASLLKLSLVLVADGRYDEAKLIDKRALEIRQEFFRDDKSDVGATLMVLANAYVAEGRLDEAEELWKRAIAISENLLGVGNRLSVYPIQNLASLYDKRGKPWDAEKLHLKAKAIIEKAPGNNDLELAEILHNLAWNYHSVGRVGDAEMTFERSFALAKKALGAGHPRLDEMLNRMVLHYAKADASLWRALPALHGLIKRNHAYPSVAYSMLHEARTAGYYPEGKRYFEETWIVMQATTSSAAAEAVTRLAQRFAAGSGPLAELLRQEQDLATEIERLNKSLIAAVSGSPKVRNQSVEKSARDRLARLAADRARVTDDITRKFPAYVTLSRPAPLALAETQKLLRNDEAILAFDVRTEHGYVWVVTAQDYAWHQIPATDKSLQDQVAELRKSLTVSMTSPFDAALAYKIYQQTILPVADKITGKKRISVVANGALTSIPLGLLVTTDPAGKPLKEVDWLIRKHAITVIPSIYSLKTMRSLASATNAPRTMIAFADPVFSKSAKENARYDRIALRGTPNLSQLGVRELGEALPQLPETRVEVQTIGGALGIGTSDLKFGLEATESAVKRTQLNQYRIVYFATHGLVAGDLAKFGKLRAEPALALSIPENPTDADDGLLQASEIAQLRLDAEWVVLSACNTASSDGVGAEALSGLARAFLYAGARSLVVSHWDVDDKTTARLMIGLFDPKKPRGRLSHGEALQEAMLQVLDSARDQDEAHPRLWAPFVVVGEPVR